MLRDYRMGQRLSGATISDYCLRTGDYPATIPQDSATIARSAATIPRLFRDYWKRAARENRAAFLIVDELAVANQRGKAHS